jgi:uncharacterized protein YcbK (DUF882 family)
MAKQRLTADVNSLSYAKSEVPYVAPPTKEILTLLDTRENQYIKTKKTIDLADELKNKIPHNKVSEPLFNDILAKIDKGISSINPENYADSELDAETLVHDIKNKMGVTELATQVNDLAGKAKEIEESKIREEKKQFKLQQLNASLKPVTKDENGRFVVPSLNMPKLVEDIAVYNSMDELFKGWKDSSMYTVNKDTGLLDINPSIQGKFGINKNTFADENELFRTGMSYLSTDPKLKEFIDDEAEFATAYDKPTSKSVLNALPPVLLEEMFKSEGKKADAITKEDIEKYTNNNSEALKELNKLAFSYTFKSKVSKDLSEKYGFSSDDMTFIDDVETLEAIKSRYATSKSTKTTQEIELGEDVGATVIPRDTATTAIPSPLSYTLYDKQIDENRSSYVNLQAQYKNIVNKGKGNPAEEARLRDTRLRLENELQIADARIQEAQTAKRNLTKSIMQEAEENGYNPLKTYTVENQQKVLKETKLANLDMIRSKQFSVDISNLVVENKPNQNGDNYGSITKIDKNNYKQNKQGNKSSRYVKLDLPLYRDIPLPLYSVEEYKSQKPSGAIVVQSKDGKYKIINTGGNITNTNENDLLTTITNKVGYQAFNILDENRKYVPLDTKDLKTVPTPNGFKEAVAMVVANPSADLDKLGLTSSAKSAVKEQAYEISKKVKVENIRVAQPLKYLYIGEGAKKGTAAYYLDDMNKAIASTFVTDMSTYKVKNQEGDWEDLPLYLKTIGLDPSHIDYSKFNPHAVLTSDREYGQLLDFPIPLTKEGLEAVKKGKLKGLADSGTLNLLAVSSKGKNSSFNIRLRDLNYKAYKESLSNEMGSGEENRKAFGTIEFFNDPASDAFNRLNLYTLADGDFKDYTTPTGEVVTINAVRKGGSAKVADNDFFITNKADDVFVYDKKNGMSKFVPYADYATDKDGLRYNKLIYSSPEDVGALMGQTMLARRSKISEDSAVQRQEVKTTGKSYTVTPGKVVSAKHSSNVNSVIATYGKSAKRIIIETADGKEQSVNSRVAASDLTNLKTIIPKAVKGLNTPYINNSVVPHIISLHEDYDLKLTSAYRDIDKNKKLEGSAENSLHMYGKSIDATYDSKAKQLLMDLQSNPQLAASKGISMAFEHVINGVPHLHIDFI